MQVPGIQLDTSSRHLTKGCAALLRPSIAQILSDWSSAQQDHYWRVAVQEAPSAVVPLILFPSTVPVNEA